MNLNEELTMYKAVLAEMKKVPENYKSRYFQDYYTELKGRIYTLKQNIKFLKTTSK